MSEVCAVGAGIALKIVEQSCGRYVDFEQRC